MVKIITNNPKVKESYESVSVFYDGEYRQLLSHAKNYVLKGHRLLSHPLSGSIKPNETYYKSILISDEVFDAIDFDSLDYIDNALDVYDKFIACKERPNWLEDVLRDFQSVDYFLISSALESANIRF